jgi:hypothetical protein
MKKIVLPAIVIIALITMTQITGCSDNDQSMQQLVDNTPVEHETLEALLLEMSGETNQFGPHPQQARKRISNNTPLPPIGDSK